MSVERDARSAAEAEYPASGMAIEVVDSIARMRQVPYANGYIRGFADGQRAASAAIDRAAVFEILDLLNESGRMRHDDYSVLHDAVSRLGCTDA